MEAFQEKFSVIEDSRHPSYVEHKLADILVMVMGAVLSGITELAEIMVYLSNKIGFYTEHFGIEKYPSKSTLSRILNMIDGDAVGCVIVELMRENAENIGSLIAVDGKAIRSTEKKGKAHSFLQILTAYATESGVTLSQAAISREEKTNEIPVFQSMLDNLNIAGKTITADAMHCQKETCSKVIQKGGDYIFGLKGNQRRLLEDVRLFLDETVNEPDIMTFQTLEKNGGRIEERICRAVRDVSWLPDLSLWSGLRTVFSITRIVTAKGKTSKETGYYISSLACHAQNLLAATRAHWQIESMHWLLDVVWDEDQSGMLSENGHKTLNSFRKLAILAHKRYIATLKRKPSVKRNVLATLLNDALLLDVIACL